MDEPKYTLIQTTGQKEDFTLPIYWRIWMAILPKKMRRRWRKHYLWKNVPLQKEIFERFRKRGNILILPFSESDFMEEEEAFVCDMFNRIILQECVQNIVVEDGLKKFIDSKFLIDGDVIPVLMIRKIVEQLCRMKRIPRKEAKIMLFDTNDVCTEFMIKQLYEEFRFITIVTPRTTYFDALRENIFEESGLLISVISDDCKEEREANIIINLSKANIYDLLFYQKEDNILLDLSESHHLYEDVMTSYYNKVEIGDGKEILPLGLLQAIICGQSSWLCKSNLEECKKELDEYGLLVHAITQNNTR